MPGASWGTVASMTALLLIASSLLHPAFASGTASPKPPAPPVVDLSALPASAAVRPPQAGEKPHPVLARLLADVDELRPGDTVRVGVLLEQQKDWHTYWKSPGDVGQPTEIAWKLPDGATVTPHEYPVPQRFELEGIVSYGYEDQVLLISQLTLPATLPPGEVTLGARVSWLVCEVNCIPGETDLALPLPVGPAGEAPPGRYAKLFDHYQAQWPTPLAAVDGFSVETRASVGEIVPDQPFSVLVTITPAPGRKLGPPPAAGTWPTFVPLLLGPNPMLMGSRVAEADGRIVATLDLMGYADDPLPKQSTFGGLLQLEVDGKRVATEVTASLPWAGAPAAATPAPAPDVAVAAASAPLPAAQPASLPMMLLAAFAGGLLLNVMPCVLPVLTLKLYGLVAHGHHGAAERRNAGLAYTAGILASFGVLAAVVLLLQATIGGVGWGFQFQYPGYVAVLATIVFAFGLSMFGVFEIPAVGADTAANASEKGGLGGHFATGVFATLLGTPCSAPFLGPAVGFAFSQPAWVVVLFFAVIGLGLAAPFLLVAWVPALFRFMPQPGPWMETFKHLMGFTLMATTVWLVSVLTAQIGTDRAIGFLAFLVFVGVGCWVFGRWGGVAESLGRQGAALLAGGVVAAGGAWLFLDLEMAAAETCDDGTVAADLDFSEDVPWQPFSEQRVAALAGKPVFIDFTAEWCLTCKANEKTILDTADVRDAMARNGVVPLKADWTRRDPVITAWLARYGRAGVPFYLVIPADPGAAPIPLPEVISRDMVVQALDKASGSQLGRR